MRIQPKVVWIFIDIFVFKLCDIFAFDFVHSHALTNGNAVTHKNRFVQPTGFFYNQVANDQPEITYLDVPTTYRTNVDNEWNTPPPPLLPLPSPRPSPRPTLPPFIFPTFPPTLAPTLPPTLLPTTTTANPLLELSQLIRAIATYTPSEASRVAKLTQPRMFCPYFKHYVLVQIQ